MQPLVAPVSIKALQQLSFIQLLVASVSIKALQFVLSIQAGTVAPIVVPIVTSQYIFRLLIYSRCIFFSCEVILRIISFISSIMTILN